MGDSVSTSKSSSISRIVDILTMFLLKYGDFQARWTLRKRRGSIWDEAKTRLMGESEASHAREIRNQTWQTNEMNPMNPPDGG